MRLAAVLLGALGAVLGLPATWIAAGTGDVAAHLVALAVASCLLGLLGTRLLAKGRARLGALLLAEALLGLGLGIGEYALIPGTLLLLSCLLAAPGR